MDRTPIRTVSNSSTNSLFSNSSTTSSSSTSFDDEDSSCKHTPALDSSVEPLPAAASTVSATPVEKPLVKRPTSLPSLKLDFETLPQLSPTRQALQKRKSMYLANCNDSSGSVHSAASNNSSNSNGSTIPVLQPPPVFGLGLSSVETKKISEKKPSTKKPNNTSIPSESSLTSLTPEQAIALVNEELSRPSTKAVTSALTAVKYKEKRQPPPLLGLIFGYSLYTYRRSPPVFASLLLATVALIYALTHVADDNRAHETAHNRSATYSTTGNGVGSGSGGGKKKGTGHRRTNSVIPPTRIDTTTSAAATASAAAAVPGSPTRRRHARRRSQSPVRLEPAPVLARLSGTFVEGPVLQYKPPQSDITNGNSHAYKKSVSSINTLTGPLIEEDENLAGFRPYPVNSWRV